MYGTVINTFLKKEGKKRLKQCGGDGECVKSNFTYDVYIATLLVVF
jgi:hypothetical protein